MIKARPAYQAGYIHAVSDKFIPIDDIEPFYSIWDAHKWKRDREDNPDGWIPAFLEYWEVSELPEPVVHR